MKKKMFFSIAAAATLLMANPGVNKADASYYNNTVSANEKVVIYQSSNMNQAEMNSIIQRYVKRYNMNWNQVEVKQDPVKQVPVQKPVQTQTKPTVQNKPTTTPAPTQPKTQQTTNTQTATSTSQLSAYEQQVVNLTNAERAKNGLPALKGRRELKQSC